MHVHSLHSGMCDLPVLSRICRESYNEPAALYETLTQRGMDLITITDHDSIDAVESLRRYPNFFLSEEVSATTPAGTRCHLGIYDITEKQHLKLQEYRDDWPRLMAYLREQRLLFAVNHVFSGLTGRRTSQDLALFAQDAPAWEVRNGHMPEPANALSSKLARELGRISLGGSDAHDLLGPGRTFTEVNGARSKQEFFAGLRAGRGEVYGDSGSCLKLTREVMGIVRGLIRERPWAWLLAPLAVGVPVFTVAAQLRDHWLAARWRAWRKDRPPAVPIEAAAVRRTA